MYKIKEMWKFIVIMIMAFMVLSPSVFAAISTDWPAEGNGIAKVENVAKNIWSTVVLVVQILAIAAVVFAGLRYMFASANVKANIKKELSYLILGAILVFATTTVVQFVVNVANAAMK